MTTPHRDCDDKALGRRTDSSHFDADHQSRPLRGSALVRLWIPIVTIAEFLGFTVPATVGVLTVSTSTGLAFPALVIAGAAEGALLGWGQATVLRQALPDFSRSRWICATAGSAAFAYVLGLGPSTWASSITRLPLAATIAISTTLGLTLLTSMGTAQWLILRSHVTHATRWIPITAAAWLAGLVVFLGFAMPLWHDGQSKILTILIGIAGGFLMAATTSVGTALGLRHMLP